ncbi:MAG: response regulator [Granulosicoccus sp.]|nr:response regulator [Granulosicoccus sp.]
MSSPAIVEGRVFESIDFVILDDDVLILEIVNWIMRDYDIGVLQFADPCQAKEYLTEHSPQLLIIDYFMPDVNGVEFLQQLKAETDLNGTKIYLCTAAMPEDSERNKINELGAELLEKRAVCDKSSLLAIVDEHCQQVRSL